MLRIISEQTWDIDQELCVCFIDMQKACDRVQGQNESGSERELFTTGAKEKEIDQQTLHGSDC